MFQVWTNLTTVLLVEGKVRKLGFKIENRKHKGRNAYMAANILAKLRKSTFLDKFLKQTRKARFVLIK